MASRRVNTWLRGVIRVGDNVHLMTNDELVWYLAPRSWDGILRADVRRLVELAAALEVRRATEKEDFEQFNARLERLGLADVYWRSDDGSVVATARSVAAIRHNQRARGA